MVKARCSEVKDRTVLVVLSLHWSERCEQTVAVGIHRK